jgi:hypothetical protein
MSDMEASAHLAVAGPDLAAAVQDLGESDPGLSMASRTASIPNSMENCWPGNTGMRCDLMSHSLQAPPWINALRLVTILPTNEGILL